MSAPIPLVAVAHGTREPEGPRVLDQLLDKVRELMPDVVVRVAFVDVIGPTLDDVLRDIDGPAVVVPLFLASGYHVRVDVPDAVATTGSKATVTPALGAAEAVVTAVAGRLREAGEPPDGVVMAAAGSSDREALAEVEAAAGSLSARLGRDVLAAYVTTAAPSVPDAVTRLRASGATTVGIASYLLAPGLFQRSLHEAGADLVAAPIGPHESIAGLIVDRYEAARPTTSRV